MIIDQITLYNFGIYRGKHPLNLTPPSVDKPIILFGGQNGSGKTTLLDALLLVFYGNQARCSNRGALSYNEFLLHSINDAINPREGASIELAFRHIKEGHEDLYELRRTWSHNGTGIKEIFEVKLNGHYDSVLSETWNTRFDEFIPLQISNLIFFDGEKIEDLANLEMSSQVLSSAIYSLLGLDLIERLAEDLLILKRKKRVSIKNSKIRQMADELERVIIDLNKRRREIRDARAKRKSSLYRIEKEFGEKEKLYHELGGNLFDQRQELELNKSSLERNLKNLADELGELASGSAPLNFIINQLILLKGQAQKELAAKNSSQLLKILESRDNMIVDLLKESGTPKSFIKSLRSQLTSDRADRTKQAKADIYLNLSSEAFALLDNFIRHERSATGDHIRGIMARVTEMKSAIVDIERKLSAVPDADQIATIKDERAGIKKELEKLKESIQRDDREIERLSNEIAQKENLLNSKIKEAVKEDFQNDVDHRIVQYSDKTIETLSKFRSLMIQKHIDRISKLILESFLYLLRKKTLIKQIIIDPNTLNLSILGTNGKSINPTRLSAGERQLLAVSILWGLARAAGRPLPAAIDTPLGRLDSQHRSNLVERYFPFASHQVFLFSTDEEITGKYFNKIAKYIGHTFLLEYNEKEKATTITTSYFPNLL